MPEPLERDLARDRDRRGMEEFADSGIDEGHTEQYLTVEVDDQPGVALVAVGIEVGALSGVEVEVDGLDPVTGGDRLLSAQAVGCRWRRPPRAGP